MEGTSIEEDWILLAHGIADWNRGYQPSPHASSLITTEERVKNALVEGFRTSEFSRREERLC